MTHKVLDQWIGILITVGSMYSFVNLDKLQTFIENITNEYAYYSANRHLLPWGSPLHDETWACCQLEKAKYFIELCSYQNHNAVFHDLKWKKGL